MNFTTLQNILMSKYFLSPSFLLYSFYIYRDCQKREKLFNNKPRPLDKSEIHKRKKHISDISYKLFLCLTEDYDKSFEGTVKIQFSLNAQEDVFLDYSGIVESVIINENECPFIFENNRIYLNSEYLKKGENTVTIKFKSLYADEKKENRGLTYKLNENKIYTNMEPFNAHYVFPLFDQPDLKANLKLTTYTHKEMTILSNSLVESSVVELIHRDFFGVEARKDHKLTKFKEIKHISPYQLMITGGNFLHVGDKIYKEEPQLNLYFNKSLEGLIKPTDIFGIVREAIQWFSGKLDSVFPFNKLDIVFLPKYEFIGNSCPGGMITIDESFLHNSADVIDRNYFSLILISQISQMWLSHSISKKSWEDSFFYESFNLFLTVLFFKEKSETDKNVHDDFKYVWLMFDFFKSKGIAADKSFDSHQILIDIEDSEEAEIFTDDEITMYKAASLVKYLYFLDPVIFWQMLRNFVSCYSSNSANKLASYRQFIDIYEMLTEKTENVEEKLLSPINQYNYYLCNEKISRLSIRLPKMEETGEFNKIVIVQEFPSVFCNENKNEETEAEVTYYPFTIDILLKYSYKEEIIKGVKVKPKKINVINLTHSYKKPLCVILNPFDNAHMTQKFDEPSKFYLLENTSEIKSAETRTMIVRDLYELIKEGDYDPLLFVKFCENLLIKETNVYIINKVLSSIVSVINNYIPQSNKSSQKQAWFKLLSEKYFKHPLFEKYLTKNMSNYLLDVMDTKDVDSLKFFLEIDIGIRTEENVDSLEINESKINILSSLDYKTKRRIVEAIYESDRFGFFHKENLKKQILDESSKLNELTLQACQLNKHDNLVRKSLWNLFVYRDMQYTEEEIKALMKGFNRGNIKLNAYNNDFRIYFKKRFFKDFPYVCSVYSDNYAIQFYKYLSPTFWVDEKILKKFLKMKFKLNFDDHPNSKLKYLIENDILQLKHKLLVIKSYSTLQLQGLKYTSFKKF